MLHLKLICSELFLYLLSQQHRDFHQLVFASPFSKQNYLLDWLHIPSTDNKAGRVGAATFDACLVGV